MGKIQSAQQRQTRLDSYFELRHTLHKLITDYDNGAQGYASEEELLDLIAKKNTVVEQLRVDYLHGLPSTALSRCPFTGMILSRFIDLYGINGLWWDYDDPQRVQEELMPTFFAMDGALKLDNHVEQVPFTCSVGPEIPFVLPRLLKHAEIKAVVSSFAVGSHRLYIITYYSEPMLNRIRRVNDLGAYCYKYKDHNGWLQHDFYQDPAKDFALEDWIRGGKLLWIYPDDHTLTLRSYLTDCPYLGLSGSHKMLAIHNGEVNETDDLDWIFETSELLSDGSDDISLEELAKDIEVEEELIVDTDESIPNEIDNLTSEEIEIKISEVE